MNEAENPFMAKITGFVKFPRVFQVFSKLRNWNSSHAVIGTVIIACVVPVCWLIMYPVIADRAAMIAAFAVVCPMYK